jgi:transposase InsO family protein
MAYEFMKENRDKHAIARMAKLLGVSRSAYYKWAKYGRSSRYAEREAELLAVVKDIQEEHHRRYGAPRIQRELRRRARRVTRKRIAKLLKKHGLNAKSRRRFIQTTKSNHGLPVCENILKRDFNASVAGQKWVSDITYIFTREGWVYLTMVLDLYDRKIIGWAISEDMEATSTTVKALNMACLNRKPGEGLIFHSDRGVQYCAGVFRDSLNLLCPTVRQSMSAKGDCWDNACAESFFKTLKRELETLDGRHSKEEVAASLFEYIEVYYNRKRLHSALDYSVPFEVECRQVA